MPFARKKTLLRWTAALTFAGLCVFAVFHTKPQEGRLLFSAAREPKELWEIEGAAHGDFYDFAPLAYEQRVVAFLALHLKRAGARRAG